MILKKNTTVEIYKDGRLQAVISFDKKRDAFVITPNSAEHIILSCVENKEVDVKDGNDK